MLTGIETADPGRNPWPTCRIDPDHGARRVEERPPLFAGVDRGVSLDEVVELAAWVVIWRPVAETIPACHSVRESCRAGLPIATTSSPTLRASESPSVAAVRLLRRS